MNVDIKDPVWQYDLSDYVLLLAKELWVLIDYTWMEHGRYSGHTKDAPGNGCTGCMMLNNLSRRNTKLLADLEQVRTQK